VVASVNIVASHFKFLRVFSEHKGHTLKDVADFEAQMSGT